MSSTRNNNSIRRTMIPRGGPALMGIIVVAVMAFVLGALLFGGGSAPETDSHDNTTEAASEPTVWTCSMHPQVNLPKSGKCPICFMDLIPIETGSGDDVGPRQLMMSEAAKSLARIQTTPAEHAYAETEIRLVGKVKFDETRLSYITAWVPGRLDQLYADYTGIKVSRGDHLVNMYSPELLAAQEELIQAITVVDALDVSASRILKTTAEATVEAARDKLRLFGLSAEQVAEIQTTLTASDHLIIYAPVGGVVVHKNAQQGMYVKTGTRIYTIADLTKLWVMFEAYESDLPWLRYGQQVSFTSQSFPGESFAAIVSFIDPVVNPKTRTVQVRAIVDNKDLKLKPDMFVRGVVKSRIDGAGRVIDDYLAGKWISPMHPEIVKSGPGTCDVCGMDLVPAESLGYSSKTRSDSDAPLLIPASAPMITGKRAIVYVEIPNDKGPLFEGREVALGPRAGDFYVVKSGVSEGELVVTNGAFKIDSELQIRAKPSMMSPEGGAPPAGHQHGQPRPGSSEHSDMAMATASDSESEATLAALAPLYNAYFAVQMALANDDFGAAVEASSELERESSAVDMGLFSRSGHGKWMVIQQALDQAARAVATSSDITEAREAFFELSKAAINLQDSFGHAGGETFYLTYCPMARNNTGAHWLQTEDIVWNSFYGEAMLRCGSIKDSLPARSHEESN